MESGKREKEGDKEREREIERRRERERGAQPTRNVRQAAMIMTNQTMTHKTIVLENCRGGQARRTRGTKQMIGHLAGTDGRHDEPGRQAAEAYEEGGEVLKKATPSQEEVQHLFWLTDMPKRKQDEAGEEENTWAYFATHAAVEGASVASVVGTIIIIFVISNLQHAHGISPASRSQKGSLSRSDNCPEQLLSTRPRQTRQGQARPEQAVLSLGTIFISRLIYSQNTFPFATVASRTSLGLHCASRLTIFKIHYNWYCSECINTNKWACQTAYPVHSTPLQSRPGQDRPDSQLDANSRCHRISKQASVGYTRNNNLANWPILA